MFKSLKLGTFAICLLISACSDAQNTETKTQDPPARLQATIPESVPAVEAVQPPPSYDEFLKHAVNDRNAASLFQYLDKDMPAYWDETEWDFHGVSRVAGKGEIACGYFVTTLLLDLGFEIDRIRLAQERSGVMIEELTKDIYISNSLEDTLAHVEGGPDEAIYIIGLDFHTGFISHSAEGTFFIHSNYIDRAGVMREYAATSVALGQSGYFMIGNLTANKDLIRNWNR